MKGTKLIILVSSILLLTISSGLLFYKNLFLMEGPGLSGKVDFEELRITDLQINATAAMMRRNLNLDPETLDAEVSRVKELLNIITDINRNNEELVNSVKKIQGYFQKKIADTEKFQTALKELKTAVDQLNPGYNELIKNKITFTVDKRDFYRECVLDSLYYISAPHRDNEARLNEDRKILSQIISFSKAPNPLIQKFSNNIDVIAKRTKEIEKILDGFNRDHSVAQEMDIVGKHFRESQSAKARDGQIFLTMVFGAIVLYLICIIFVLRRLT